jgi:4'-phosphopantetheinyl transferase
MSSLASLSAFRGAFLRVEVGMANEAVDSRLSKQEDAGPASPWQAPPAELALGQDDVHVWRTGIALEPGRLQELRKTLSAQEQTRAERFRHAEDRDHFVAAHGLLRAVLAGYLEVPPGDLQFREDPHGKPALSAPADRDWLQFNMSHSHDLALYAVSCNRQVGVDLERLRSDVDLDAIARRFFSPGETASLLALPSRVRREAFFNCWTRKEAFIKATGEGVVRPLPDFDVSLVPGEPAALLNTRPDPAEAPRWRVVELAPGPGYAAALVAQGASWQLSCWQWPAG